MYLFYRCPPNFWPFHYQKIVSKIDVLEIPCYEEGTLCYLETVFINLSSKKMVIWKYYAMVEKYGNHIPKGKVLMVYTLQKVVWSCMPLIEQLFGRRDPGKEIQIRKQ